MSTEMSDTSPGRAAISRRSMQQAGDDFDEVMRLADAERSVVLTRGGKDHLIVLGAEHARALVEQLEQATARVIASPEMRDRGSTPEIASLTAAVAGIKSLMRDRGG